MPCISRMTLAGFAMVALLGNTHAAPRDPAPVPDEVLARLPGVRATTSPMPLVQDLARHHHELTVIADQLETRHKSKEGRDQGGDKALEGGGTARHMVMEAKAHELGVLVKAIGADRTLSESLRAGLVERVNTLIADLASIRGASKPEQRGAALEKLKADLARFNPADAPEPLGPVPGFSHELARPLVTKADSAKKRPAYADAGNSGVQFAFTGSAQQLAAVLPPNALDPTSCNYQSVDLADDGRNVQLTSDIRQLAAQLNYSPARIADWIRQNIRFEPYFFAHKGSTGTLQSRGGGPFDQASLMIALLRASNIPARYVLGDVIVQDDAPAGADARIAKWFGVQNYAAANQLLAQGNFPNTGYVPTGNDVSTANGVHFNHVWVEACVPYAHYRGSRLDGGGQRWVPLDPSFRQPDYQAGLSIGSVDIDYAAYMAKRTLETPDERFKTNTRTYTQGLNPPRTIDEVPYSGADTQPPLDVLPTTLPYDVATFLNWPGQTTSEVAVLPDAANARLNVEFRDKNDVLLMPAFEAMAADIMFKRMTLGFDGATAADQAAITNWRLDSSSTSALPCPRQTIPFVNIEGTRKATGTAGVDLCSTDNTINLRLYATWNTAAPGIELFKGLFTRRIQAASLHALVVGANKVSEQLLRDRAKLLLGNVRASSDPNTNVEGIEGEFLHLVGLKWLYHLDDAAKSLADLNQQSLNVTPALGLISTQAKVQKALDMPFGVSRTGYLVDVFGGNSSIGIADGQLSSKYAKALAYAASNYESYVWQENARTDAVSTVRGLQFAQETGIPLLTLNKSTWASQKPNLKNNASLNYSDAQISSIENTYFCASCDNFTVTMPRTLISYGDAGSQWIGYVIEAEAFSATKNHVVMAITQGANGGYSVSLPVSYTFSSALNTGFSYFTPPPAPDYSSWTTAVYAPPPTITAAIGLGVTPYATFGGDPVNLVNGNVYHNESDLSIKGRGGLNFSFDRAYNSRDAKDGPLGYGWTHSLHQYLLFSDDNPDGQTTAADTDKVVSSMVWVNGSGSRKAIASNGSTTFTTPAGFFFTMTKQANGTFLVSEKSGLKYTFESKSVPSPAPADDTAAYAGRARLVSIQDRNGNTLTLSYAAATGCAGTYVCKVTDDLNRSLTFTYNSAGRLDTIADWTGRKWQYGYDATGNLTSFKNPRASVNKQNAVSYAYYSAADGANLDHALKSYTLPRGNGMTFEYYINGRAFRHFKNQHPASVTTFSYNDFRRETLVTDERANTRHYFFDRNGNTEKILEPDGGVRSYTFDCRSTTDCPNPYNKLSETDPTGLTINYAFDTTSPGSLAKTSFPASSTTVERYDYGSNTFGQPRRIKNARGVWTIMRYDTKGNLTDEIHLKSGFTPAACSTECPIPAAANIVMWTQKQYDSYGNITQVKRMRDFTAQTGPTVSTDYNDTVNSVAGLNAVKMTRSGDKTGDGVIDANDPADVANLTYDNLGRVKQGIDASWYAANVDLYDEVDRVKTASDGASRSYETDYDDNGNVIERRMLVSGTVLDRVKTGYDQDDHPNTSTNNAGAITQIAYDDAGNTLQTINPDNYQVLNEYDALNRLIRSQDAEGNLVQRDYDVGGRIQRVIDPFKVARTYTYYNSSKEGRLRRATMPAIQGAASGRATEYDYDAAGNVIRLSQIGSDGTTRDHYKFYDELDRMVREVSPAVDGTRRQVCRKFSNLGDLTELWVGPTTDNTTATCNFSDTTLKKQVTYTYDDFGRRLTETDPLSRVRSWTYDFHGKVLTYKDGKNQTTTYTWKADGLPDTRKDSAARVTTWTYYPNGQIQTVTSPAVTYTYTYDTAHRVQTINDSRGNKTLTYSYSAGGLLNRMTDAESRPTDYIYDGVGRLIGQWMPNNGFVAWGYDADGRLNTRWSDDNVTATYAWNADGSMASKVNVSGDKGVVTRHDYTYNAFGQRDTHLENLVGTSLKWRYAYNDLGQLREIYKTPVAPTAGAEVGYRYYRYDVFGNRTKEIGGNQYFLTSYDAAQQATRMDAYSPTDALLGNVALFTFDANGSMLTKQSGYGTLTLGWDELNQLKTAKLQDDTGAVTTDQSYTYDASGRRVAKTVGGTTTSYLYNGGDAMAAIYGEYASWTAPQALRADGPGMDDPVARLPLSSGQFQAAKYYDSDGAGTVDAMTISGQTGVAAVDGKIGYDAWGQPISSGGTNPPLYGPSYQGRERDETFLMNFRARYYDPATVVTGMGRFVSRDPLGYNGGLNLYAAFDNDPVNNSDPSGTTTISPAAIDGLIRDYNSRQFMDSIGLGGLRSSNQSLEYASRRQDPYANNTTQNVQTALGFASMVPGLGTVTGLASAVIDLANGDNVSAAISLASAIPFVGMEVGALKSGLAMARGAESTVIAAARAEAGVAYGSLDALGRPTGVAATITAESIGTGSAAARGITPPGYVPDAGYARGHLLGAQLGGSGSDPRNLVTLLQNPTNSPVMRGFENQVRKSAEQGQIINYSVTPIYKSSNPIPCGVTMCASGSGGLSFGITVLNPPGM